MAIQYSGGISRNDVYAGLISKAAILADINTTLVAAGWSSSALHAFTVFTLASVPLNTETVTLAGKVYTYKTVINNANDGDVLIGSDAAASLVNLKAAVNLGTGAGTLYSTATTANTNLRASRITGAWLVIEQIAAGASTGLTVSETVTNGAFTSSTVNYSGYVCTSATTPADLGCKYYFFDAQEGNLAIRNYASDLYDTYYSTTAGTGEQLFNIAALDLRVQADKYQCFVFQNNVAGSATNSFWSLGVPYIPDFLIGLAVSNVTSAAGLIKITTSTVHGLSTGNLVASRGIGGVSAANVTNNAITVVDTTSFTLNGSTFSGAYTSGGRVGVSSIGQANFKVVEAVWQGGTSSSGNWIRRVLSVAGATYWTLLNGSSTNNGNGEGSLRFASIVNGGLTTTELLWGDGSALVTEPLLVFGTASASIGPIIGQCWNSVIARKIYTRDESTTTPLDSHTYWNLTDSDSSAILGSFLYAVA